MQDRLRRVADGPYWRYPTLRLNQINWYAEVYNAATLATGDPIWLQRDLRGQLTAFVRSIRSPAPNTAGSLGPGMQFHYLPHAGSERRSSTSSRPSTRTSSPPSRASTTARSRAACGRCRPPTRRCCAAG